MTSPLNCIQEIVPLDEHYPWRVMVTCILLNRTHGRQVRPMIDELWTIVPEPKWVLDPERIDALRTLLRPLGFVNKRLLALQRATADYVRGVPPSHCYGMGQYGRDAIAIFVEGRIDLEPSDTWLKPYLEWRRAGGPPVPWNLQAGSSN